LLLAYLLTTSHPCSDIITYLLAFYLLLVAVNYFTPRGLEEDDEDQELYSLDDSLNSICTQSTFQNIN
jgi:threonine/homoserine/homoserine lactone efflux protein